MSAILERLRAGVESASPEETARLAADFAAALPENRVLTLRGDLGVGKTTWVRGMARAWGITEPVTSPTFNLFVIYNGQRQLVHLDAYRLGSPEEAESLLIEDFLRPPWCLAVEWPERLGDFLPADAWSLSLRILAPGVHQIALADCV
ncbi:MAG: tRNA (adenosine(37)-N6)-threonylcarbamoyltransferase complex ATPase subunit type 1 TsaE [Verrucomicrobiota bacterium]